MPTFEAGQIFDRYRIVRWLGSGVSGESYEADDSILLRKVTLKLIHPQETLPDAARRQFFREMQGISVLSHPYIASVLDYGEINGRLYVARRYVSYGSLLGTEGRSWFSPPLNMPAAIRYLHQLAQALQSIHLRGYVHGALTFANILVLRAPDPQNPSDFEPFLLADVGLGQFVRRFGQHQQLPLLPLTAAPEQLGRRVIPASDQYALAVLLYFWLSGRPPYIGTAQEVERQKLTETITPLSSIDPRVTIEQDGILLRALSVYPEDRYPTILAFAEAMLGSLKDKPSSTAISDASAITRESDLSDTPPHQVQESPGAHTEQESDPSASTEQLDSEHTEPAQEPATTAQETDTELEQVVAIEPQEAPEPVSISQEAIMELVEELEPVSIDQEATAEPQQATVLEPEEISADQLPEMPQTDAPLLLDETQDAHPFDNARVIIASPYANDPVEVPLKHDEVTVGRAGSSDILLDHDNLTSRHHALFRREAHGYILYDRRSANGVYVNGQKISSEEGYELMDGDHISIGNYELIFRTSPTEIPAARDETDDELSAQHELTRLI